MIKSEFLRNEPRELDGREQQHRADYEWVLHDPGIQQTFAGKVVAVHNRKIWGQGPNHTIALEDALRAIGCPPEDELALVFVEGRPIAPG